MTPADLLRDGFGRIVEDGVTVVDGLSRSELEHRPTPEANPIGWLVWHLTRVQDDHLADAAGRPQVWTEQGYADRFGLDLPDGDTGYGHTADEVAKVQVEAADLADYLRAVHAVVDEYVAGLGPEDLDRIVDTRWDPPVSLGVRLVSVLDDSARHLGQAAYVRGLLGR